MINKDFIRGYATNVGNIVGELDTSYVPNVDGFIKLTHPLRLMPTQDGRVAVAAIFVKEDWCILKLDNAIEISISNGIKDLYCDYESQIFGSIVQAPEKKIII